MAARTAPPLRKALKRSAPGLVAERELWAAGHDTVVGIDEVGRGAWAGPLTIGAVVLPQNRRINKVRDSKALTANEREALFGRLTDWCSYWAVGHASARECDELGMSDAQRLAARRAIDGLGIEPDHILIDGKWDFIGGGNTKMIVKGDATCLSIATASILAKVTRDRIMVDDDLNFPAYDFAWNKGYPCPRHQQALRGVGPSALHRRSWSWMDDIPWTGARRYIRPGPQGSLFEPR